MTTPRLILLMLVLNVLVVAGGVVMNYMMLRPVLSSQSAAAAAADAAEVAVRREYEFYPVEKIIVSLREGGRENYFVLDLMLLTEAQDEPSKLERVEPLVRNSVISYLSSLQFSELRGLPISELQGRLEQVLLADFDSKNAEAPFEQVLVSKLIVQ